MKKAIKNILKFFQPLINRLPFNNSFRKYRLDKNSIALNKATLRNCKFSTSGKNNVIILKEGTVLNNCEFNILGNNNCIQIENDVLVRNGSFWIEDDNNKITIGKQTKLCGKIQLACIEGTTITIGEDCLFSSDIVFRTGDSHSILDMDGNRINPSKDIWIGDRVWIGHRAIINKGVNVSNNSVIATGAIVTKNFLEENTVIGGIPAKIIKRGIKWSAERI